MEGHKHTEEEAQGNKVRTGRDPGFFQSSPGEARRWERANFGVCGQCDRCDRRRSQKWKSRVQQSVIAPSPTPTNTDMSLPYSVSGLSKNRKHSAAEDRRKGVGSSGTGLGDPDGPPPAPAHREHLKGQEFGDMRKQSYSSRRPNSATSDATRQDQDLAASAEARSILRTVKESPNVHPPLKSVAGDLCFILDNCKVWPPSRPFNPKY